MPMMMHHDGQPLYTRDGLYGLLNQVRFLRKAGAQSMQVTVLTPAVGTRSYEPIFEKGLVFGEVAGRRVLQHQFDGNHVVASDSTKPWRVQLNVLLAYASFYNPLNFVVSMVRPANKLYLLKLGDQLVGMSGLVGTAISSARWSYRLWRGPIQARRTPPGSQELLVDVSATPDRSNDVALHVTAQPEPAQAESPNLV